MSNFPPCYKISTLSEFIGKVKECRQRWELDPHEKLWFRGEDADYDDQCLRPKIYRPKSKAVALKPIDELLEIEYDLLIRFRQESSQYQSVSADPDYETWDWYFLMQLHGAPTRLLDWSESSLIALYFAVRDVERKSDVSDPCVFVHAPVIKGKLNVSVYNRYIPRSEITQKFPIIKKFRNKISLPNQAIDLLPDYNRRRIAAQRSRFVLFGRDPAYLCDRYNNDNNASRALVKIEIDKSQIEDIRMELRDSGITESLIFPDLDGVGREIYSEWLDRI